MKRNEDYRITLTKNEYKKVLREKNIIKWYEKLKMKGRKIDIIL